MRRHDISSFEDGTCRRDNKLNVRKNGGDAREEERQGAYESHHGRKSTPEDKNQSLGLERKQNAPNIEA